MENRYGAGANAQKVVTTVVRVRNESNARADGTISGVRHATCRRGHITTLAARIVHEIGCARLQMSMSTGAHSILIATRAGRNQFIVDIDGAHGIVRSAATAATATVADVWETLCRSDHVTLTERGAEVQSWCTVYDIRRRSQAQRELRAIRGIPETVPTIYWSRCADVRRLSGNAGNQAASSRHGEENYKI